MSHAAGVAGASGGAGISEASIVAVETLVTLDTREGIALIALGCDALPAMRELGNRRASVIIADLESDFEELVGEMRSREYHWHIVLYRTHEGNAGRGGDDAADHNQNNGRDHNGDRSDNHRRVDSMSYFANHSRALPNSRGSVFFFRDYRVFAEAQAWCAATLPRTYLKPRQG